LEISVETLRGLCLDDKVKWTLHALKRMRERKISAQAVIDTILSGEIIERYQDDKPFPSCLIFNCDYKNTKGAIIYVRVLRRKFETGQDRLH
jgi:translation elongation factor EF-4